MLSPDALLLIEAVVTLFLTGLIWTIQVVHYPLMDGVGPECFAAYEARHTKAITPLVAPTIAVELLLAVMAPWTRPDSASAAALAAGAALSITIVLVTAAISVPCHARLAGGYDPAAHRRLVRSNWLRTLAWTARAGLLIAALWPKA